MLDDFLMAADEPMPFGMERSTHAFMGRFGNLMLVNGEPDHELDVVAGEVVRLYLTNVSNTRTFNLSFEGTGAPAPASPRIKVVGTDVGAFEREEWVESIVLSPAERYIVHVRFDEPGELVLVNRVQGIDHLGGAFFSESDTLGAVRVAEGESGATSAAFDTLRTNQHAAREIALYREYFDDPVSHELTFTLQTDGIPFVVDRLMQFDSAYFHPVEWSGTMPMMNWNSSSAEVTWIVREPSTGAENMGHRLGVRGRRRRQDPAAQRASVVPRHAAPVPHPRTAIPGPGAQWRPERESRLEGHGPASHRDDHRHPARDHQPRPVDGALPHLRAPRSGGMRMLFTVHP